tara:strand:+ start:166 stop:576 length:411 start_codon:yes stop_codon:yes gene_type:complete
MDDSLKNNGSSLKTGAPDELRLRVLRALEANPELTQRQLAEELGISLGGVNYAVKALVEHGLVKMKNFVRSDHKASYLYILTPSGIAQKTSLASALLGRKLEEYDLLMREIGALRREVELSEGTKEYKGPCRSLDR